MKKFLSLIATMVAIAIVAFGGTFAAIKLANTTDREASAELATIEAAPAHEAEVRVLPELTPAPTEEPAPAPAHEPVVEELPSTSFVEETVDGQNVFFGDREAIIEHLSSLSRQDWMDLAVISRFGGEFYGRVEADQSEVILDGGYVSAYRMTADRSEYAILRDGALLVSDADGEVVVDSRTCKVSGVSDSRYPQWVYSDKEEALYEGQVKAKAFTRANVVGTLKVSDGFTHQEIFKALVLVEGEFEHDGRVERGYVIAWRVVSGGYVSTSAAKASRKSGSSSQTVRPTTKAKPAHEPEATLPPKQGTVTREEQEATQPQHEAEPTVPPKQGTVGRDGSETKVSEPTPTQKPSAAHAAEESLPTMGSSKSSSSSTKTESAPAPTTPPKQSSAPSHATEADLPAMGGDQF